MTREPKRYFFPLDPTLPDEERLRVAEGYKAAVSEDLKDLDEGEEVPVHPDDIEVWRAYTKDPSEKIRAYGVDLLCEYGPITWDDLETWALDPSDEIKNEVIWSMEGPDWHEAAILCDADRHRCVSLLARVADQYDEYFGSGIALQLLSEENKEWLEITWRAADSLLHRDRPDLNAMLICCYFEHVILDNNWGPDDPHLRAWIEDSDTLRKKVLLSISDYQGLERGRLRDITEALAQDSDPEIARAAKGITDGTIRYCDLFQEDET